MPDSYFNECVEACVTAINSLGLVDDDGNSAPVHDRDIPVVREDDILPMILVSAGREDQGEAELFSAQQIANLYPVQITVVGASDRSDSKGRDTFQYWKETIWNRFNRKQPWPITHELLFRVDTRVGMVIEPDAWKVHFNVAVLFVMIQLQHIVGTALPTYDETFGG